VSRSPAGVGHRSPEPPIDVAVTPVISCDATLDSAAVRRATRDNLNLVRIHSVRQGDYRD
jgi:hypothetical protein